MLFDWLTVLHIHVQSRFHVFLMICKKGCWLLAIQFCAHELQICFPKKKKTTKSRQWNIKTLVILKEIFLEFSQCGAVDEDFRRDADKKLSDYQVGMSAIVQRDFFFIAFELHSSNTI